MVPASMLIGVRHALERDRDRAAVPVGSALLGSVLAVTALRTTAVFGASLSHLTSTPALYGQPFDLTLSPPGPATQFSQLVTALTGNRAYWDISLGVGEDIMSINGPDRLRGTCTGQSLRGQAAAHHDQRSASRRRRSDRARARPRCARSGPTSGSLVRVTAPGARGQARTSTRPGGRNDRVRARRRYRAPGHRRNKSPSAACSASSPAPRPAQAQGLPSAGRDQGGRRDPGPRSARAGEGGRPGPAGPDLSDRCADFPQPPPTWPTSGRR